MERVIRVLVKDRRGNLRVSYLYDWRAARPGCRELPSWTPRQRDAKRYPFRSLAEVDLARVLEWDSHPGTPDLVKIVKVIGTHALARRYVAAQRLAEDLDARKAAPALARAASRRVAAACLDDLEQAVERLDRERRERMKAFASRRTG